MMQAIPENEQVDDVLIDLLNSNNVKYILLVHESEPVWTGRAMAFSKKAKSLNICTVNITSLSSDKSNFNDAVQNLVSHQTVRYVVVMAGTYVTKKLIDAVTPSNQAKNSLVLLTFGVQKFPQSQNLKYLNIIPSLDAEDILKTCDDFITDYNNMLKSKTQNPWMTEYCNANLCSNPDEKQDIRLPFLFLALKATIEALKDCEGSLCTSDKTTWPQDVLKLTRDVQLIIDGSKQSIFNSDGFLNPGIIKFKLEINDAMGVTNVNYVKGKKLDILEPPSKCPSDPCIECGQSTTTTAVIKTTTTAARVTTTLSLAERNLITIPKVDYLTGVFGQIPMRTEEEYGLRDSQWIIALGVLASLGVLAVIIFEITILYKLLGTELGNQWRTMWLGQLLLFGVLLCFLTLFAYLPKPTQETCGITRFGVGFSYSVVFSVMLVKLMVILTSKTSDGLLLNDTESPNYLRGTYQILLFIFSVGVQLVINIQWLLTVPPRAVPVIDFTGNRVWICNHYTWSTQYGAGSMEHFLRNNFENHLLTLVYIMFLILVTTFVSMKAHGIITNHRESVFIGISAGLSIPLWIAWTLIGGLNRKSIYAEQYGDACMAFGLFLTGSLILFAMFLPKVRQMVNMGMEGVYLEDDRDTTYGSAIMPPPSYKSGYRGPGSVVYINNGSVFNESFNKDPMALHLKHPGSTYSGPTYIKTKGPESLYGTSRVLKVTPDLTGRIIADRRRTQSEHNYPVGGYSAPRSEKGSTIIRARSTHDLGAL